MTGYDTQKILMHRKFLQMSTKSINSTHAYKCLHSDTKEMSQIFQQNIWKSLRSCKCKLWKCKKLCKCNYVLCKLWIIETGPIQYIHRNLQNNQITMVIQTLARKVNKGYKTESTKADEN